MLRTLAVLPLLVGGMADPIGVPTPESTATVVSVPEPNLHAAIRDLKLTIEPLETETGSGLRTTITISSDVLFAFDQADLTKVATRHLARIAGRLRNASGTAQVDGHTDAIGTNAYNRRLSQRRAQAVERELDRLLGGSPRVLAVGHGEADPVAPNTYGGKDNPPGRAKNRRVTITFQSSG